MPQLKWSQPALIDLARLRGFLAPKSPDAARRAISSIRQGVKLLGSHPELGRPVDDMLPEFREWIIDFGQAAYIVLYHFNGAEIVILAIRHSRGVGY